jgi:hypothetical protein
MWAAHSLLGREWGTLRELAVSTELQWLQVKGI